MLCQAELVEADSLKTLIKKYETTPPTLLFYCIFRLGANARFRLCKKVLR